MIRRRPLKAKPPADHSAESGHRAWKSPIFGPCVVCSRPGRLQRHHIVMAQHVRRIPGADPWDLRNSIELCAECHADQHSGKRRIPLAKIPDAALSFAVELLGEHAATDYVRRYYAD